MKKEIAVCHGISILNCYDLPELDSRKLCRTVFQTTYCLTAVAPPKIDVTLSLAYKNATTNEIIPVNGMYRDEPDTDPLKLRKYFLAAKFDNFPTNPSFPVEVKVKVDSAALNIANPLPIETFGSSGVTKFDRTLGTTIGQFFQRSITSKRFYCNIINESCAPK